MLFKLIIEREKNHDARLLFLPFGTFLDFRSDETNKIVGMGWSEDNVLLIPRPEGGTDLDGGETQLNAKICDDAGICVNFAVGGGGIPLSGLYKTLGEDVPPVPFTVDPPILHSAGLSCMQNNRMSNIFLS